MNYPDASYNLIHVIFHVSYAVMYLKYSEVLLKMERAGLDDKTFLAGFPLGQLNRNSGVFSKKRKKGEKQKIYSNKSKHENQYLTTELCILMAFKI